MIASLALLAALAAAPALAPTPASAPLLDPEQRDGLQWRPLSLTPVALPAVMVPALDVPPASARTALDIGPRAGARVCADALVGLRVRAEPLGPGPVELRLWRLSGRPGEGRVALTEPADRLSPGTWRIDQTHAAGELLIAATAPARLVVEAADLRTGELIWEHTAGAVLEWIAGASPLPPLPEVPGAAHLRRELLADAAIADALRRADPGDPALHQAVRAWRSAAALQRIAALRPLARPAFAPDPRPLAPAGAPDLADGWHALRGPGPWDLDLHGPGLAVIDAGHMGQVPGASLSVRAAGRRLGRLDLPAAPRRRGDVPAPGDLEDMSSTPCPSAQPRDADPLDPAGPTRSLALALAPGRHTYRLHLDGDAARVRVRAGRGLPRLAAALGGQDPAALVRDARRALARATSPRAALVDALLALVDGRPILVLDPPGGGPVLALAHTWLEAQVDDLPAGRRRALARDLARAADRVRDHALAARARVAGLELLAGLDAPDLARALAGPRPEDLPPAALGELARQLAGPALPVASPSLALLARARARAPHDPELRAVLRDHWRDATRWAALRPDLADAPWTWIERLPPDPERPATHLSLWSWPNGPARTVAAPRAAESPGRPALLRLYANLSPGTPDARLDLQLGEHRWRTLALADLEELRLALPPGEHRLALAAPAGADLWSSLPPDPARPPDARLLRLWPLRRGAPLRFPISGAPTAVRVELRSLDPARPIRASLQVRSDVGPARRIVVDLPAAADAPAPTPGAPRLGGRASVLVPLDPRARAVTLVLDHGAPDLAVSAAIRAPGAAPEPPVPAATPDARPLPTTTALPATPDASSPVPATIASPVPAATPDASSPGLTATPDATAADALATVERTSRALLTRPHDRDLLFARAHALIDLGQLAHAHVDWLRLTERPLPRSAHAAALRLAARLDALDAPGHIDLRIDGPALVSPALALADLDDADLDRLAPLAARARAQGPAAALADLGDRPAPRLRVRARTLAVLDRDGALPDPTDAALRTGPLDHPPRRRAVTRRLTIAPQPAPRPTALLAAPLSPETAPASATLSPETARAAAPRHQPPTAAPSSSPNDLSPGSDHPAPAPDLATLALRAALLDAADRPDDAATAWARVYAATDRWQTGLAAAHSALDALERRPDPAGAGLAYGLALRLRPIVGAPAIHRLLALAGERSRWSRLIVSEGPAARERLVLPLDSAAASPDAAVRAALLAPPWPADDALVLRPGRARPLALRPGATELPLELWCRALRPDLGGAAPEVRVSLVGEALRVEPVPPDTVHALTLTGLPRDAGGVDLELDVRSAAHVCLARVRPAHGRDPRATGVPTRWHVAGPRPVEFAVYGPTTLEVEARPRGPGAAPPLRLALARDDGPFRPAMSVETGLSAPGPSATHLLTIADPGAHRVRIAADRGSALIRVRQRLDAPGDAAAPPPPPLRTYTLPEPPLAAAPPAPPALPRERPPVQRFGTPSVDLHLGTDDLEDTDDLRPRISGVVRLGWARELLARRLWLSLDPELRPREDTALVAGGRLTLQTVFPRAGLRARLSGLGLVQAEGDRPWSARAELRLDRPTWIAPRLQLLPGLDLAYRHQSEDDPNLWHQGELHPRVYQRYVEQHPLVVRPGLDLRIVPFQDARVVVGADLMPNSDLRSLDQVNLHAGIGGAPALHRRIVPEFLLDYEASVRLRDDDRSQTYLRSRILASLGVSFWLRDVARIGVGVRDSLYLSAPFPARNGLDLWLRLDLPLGRGLRDLGPFDLTFRPAREHRLWRQEPAR